MLSNSTVLVVVYRERVSFSKDCLTICVQRVDGSPLYPIVYRAQLILRLKLKKKKYHHNNKKKVLKKDMGNSAKLPKTLITPYIIRWERTSITDPFCHSLGILTSTNAPSLIRFRQT